MGFSHSLGLGMRGNHQGALLKPFPTPTEGILMVAKETDQIYVTTKENSTIFINTKE
jgi:hypothetical protein